MQTHAASLPPLRDDPGIPRVAWMLGCAAASTAVAWWVVATLPPMPVRVEFSVRAMPVPLGYQLCVFPAFGAFVGALAADVARRVSRSTWVPRAALVAGLGTLAAARIAGALPLSGHALFLFGALAYEIVAPARRDADCAVSLCLLVPALLVVSWCKLVVWSDPWWFGASAALGAAAGMLLARAARS